MFIYKYLYIDAGYGYFYQAAVYNSTVTDLSWDNHKRSKERYLHVEKDKAVYYRKVFLYPFFNFRYGEGRGNLVSSIGQLYVRSEVNDQGPGLELE